MRALAVRLREYAQTQRSTAEQLLDVVAKIEQTRQDVNPETQGLSDTASLLTHVADDIEKLLAGEELGRWRIEAGVRP